MQRSTGILALAVTFLAAGVGARTMAEAGAGGAKKPAVVTITGTLVDTRCYSMSAENMGNDHGDMPGCGAACAASGIPVGIVKDGKKGDPAIILLAPAKSFAAEVGKTVRASGTYVWHNAALRPDKVEVQDGKGNWTEIVIKTMM